MPRDGAQQPVKVTQIFGWQGLKRVEIERADAGDIVAVAGIEDIRIGDTIADRDNPQPLPPLRIDEPTIAMIFSANNSPWAGRERANLSRRASCASGCFTSSARMSACGSKKRSQPDSFQVTGRGEFQLAIVIETMRREGYELQVSKPTVITREIDGKSQ